MASFWFSVYRYLLRTSNFWYEFSFIDQTPHSLEVNSEEGKKHRLCPENSKPRALCSLVLILRAFTVLLMPGNRNSLLPCLCSLLLWEHCSVIFLRLQWGLSSHLWSLSSASYLCDWQCNFLKFLIRKKETHFRLLYP